MLHFNQEWTSVSVQRFVWNAQRVKWCSRNYNVIFHICQPSTVTMTQLSGKQIVIQHRCQAERLHGGLGWHAVQQWKVISKMTQFIINDPICGHSLTLFESVWVKPWGKSGGRTACNSGSERTEPSRQQKVGWFKEPTCTVVPAVTYKVKPHFYRKTD